MTEASRVSFGPVLEANPSPITYRAAGDDPVELEDVGAVSVSARQIKFMTVSYLPVDDEDASDE